MGKKVPVISIGVGMADMDKLKKKMKKTEMMNGGMAMENHTCILTGEVLRITCLTRD